MAGGRTERHTCNTPFMFGTHKGSTVELITVAADRDFESGQSNWSVISGDDISWDETDMDFNCDEENWAAIAITLTEGYLYRLKFDISAYTSGTLSWNLGGTIEVSSLSATGIVYGSTIAGAAANYLAFGSADFIGSIDNISLKLASATLKEKGADFLSCGCEIGMPIYNTTTGTNGLITAVTEDTITDDTNKWAGVDEYEIYLQTKDSFISSQIVDRSRGWRTDPKDMEKGWRKEDVDLDRDGQKIFGPGFPEGN